MPGLLIQKHLEPSYLENQIQVPYLSKPQEKENQQPEELLL